MWLGKDRRLPFILGVCGVVLVSVASGVFAEAGSELVTKQFQPERGVAGGVSEANLCPDAVKSSCLDSPRGLVLLLRVGRVRQVGGWPRSGELKREEKTTSRAFPLATGSSCAWHEPEKSTFDQCVLSGAGSSGKVGRLVRPVTRHVCGTVPSMRWQRAKTPPPRDS